VRLSYPAPRTLGADRLADVCGAFSRYGAPTIVADFGTAATFNVILPRRGFVGGVIAPGPRLMTEYLADRTALLPRIRGAGRWGDVGRSTKGSMLIGARVGYRGMVREIVRHLLSGLRGRRATLVATGGLAREAVAGTDLPFLMDPHLTLYGLSRIFELNR
jgi:type III pantothenate kinase